MEIKNNQPNGTKFGIVIRNTQLDEGSELLKILKELFGSNKIAGLNKESYFAMIGTKGHPTNDEKLDKKEVLLENKRHLKVTIPDDVVAIKRIKIHIDKSLMSGYTITCNQHFCNYNSPIAIQLNKQTPCVDYELDFHYRNREIP